MLIIALFAFYKKKWQLASNPSRKYSMKHLIGKLEIDGQIFSVAGRENELLAIENHANEELGNVLHELLTDWLREHL